MESKKNPHHLVLGMLNDYLTGKEMPDTHDERYRQKIARHLVETAGFSKNDISSNIPLTITADHRKASLKIDFMVRLENKNVVMIKYAPGSLVTRRISTLALSRVASPYQIPYVIITNGEDAEIIDGDSGELLFEGILKLPDRDMINKNIVNFSFNPIQKKMFEQASRIAFACEIDGACPCDTDVCEITE